MSYVASIRLPKPTLDQNEEVPMKTDMTNGKKLLHVVIKSILGATGDDTVEHLSP